MEKSHKGFVLRTPSSLPFRIMQSSLIVFLVFVASLVVQRFLRKLKPGQPPGPKGWPIVGNLFDMPTKKTWHTFAEWGKQYGPISFVAVFGQPIIIINSLKVARRILDEKGSIYSDRPQLPMGGELIGWKHALPLVRYGETFQLYRRRFHQLFGTPADTKAFHKLEIQAVQSFLDSICRDPEDLIQYIKKHVGTVSLRIVYGYEVTEKQDPFVHLLDRGMTQFAVATAPGAFPVDVFPPLRYLPSWFPGGGFHLQAKIWGRDLDDMATKPFDHMKRQLEGGMERHCFLSTFLPEISSDPRKIHDLKWTASSIAAGGFTTRLSALQAFFCLMASNPEVQIKAHAEIKAVVGIDRFPTFEDRPYLPYINAICREIYRFHTVVPNGLPHMVMEDDIYDGYLIPKGSIVIANIWNMLRDPEIYADPHTFNPSRFISSEGHAAERDVYDIIFGFGRRKCPGRVLGDETLFITAAMSLAVLNISESVDEDGHVIGPVYKPMSGVVR
ncbi:hypothetical protein C0995_002252 [Termitomyces sp. Mi166|nr:hypothetical protein C0995_002252 [Termitomyces sp. Mi166\